MANLDYVLQAMNLFVGGFPKLGTCDELATPKIEKQTEDFRSGGMLAGKKHVLGYKPFEFGFGLSAYDPQVITQVGLFSKNAITISFLGAFDGDNNAQHSSALITRGKFTDVDPGKWQAGKKAMLNVKGSLDAMKLTIDGTVIYDIDIDADKYMIGGVDEYAWIRAALG